MYYRLDVVMIFRCFYNAFFNALNLHYRQLFYLSFCTLFFFFVEIDMKKKSPIHELRLGLYVIAFSDDPFVLLVEKAEIIAKQSIRYCEGLKIYWHGSMTEWLFDISMTQKSASRFLADWLTHDWYMSKFGHIPASEVFPWIG